MTTELQTTDGTVLEGNIPAQVAAVVRSRDPQAKVYLYGSRARKDHHEDSDWDFFVATTVKNPRKLEDDLTYLVYDIILETDEFIQILTYPKASWEAGLSPSPLYDNIRKEGIEL